LTADPALGSSQWVDRVLQAYSALFTSFVAHTNRVGFEDGLNFWGGASVYDPNGNEIGHGPYHQEAMTLVEMDLNQLHRTRARLPLLRDERTGLIMREMQRILSSKEAFNGR
jgi:predicted amidohydrolase